jgi:hypothetical protein
MQIGWNTDSGAYAFNQRASWESTDFESLFSRRAGIPSEGGKEYQGADAASLEADALTPEFKGSGVPFRAPSVINEDAGTPTTADIGIAADVQDAGLDADFQAAIADSACSSAVVLEDRGVSLPSDTPVDSNALLNLEQPTDGSSVQSERTTVSVKGSEVQVWIRNATIPTSSMPDVAGLLRTELSWRGLVLSSLKINGQSLVAVRKMSAAQGLLAAEGGIQEGQRILEGNDYGG